MTTLFEDLSSYLFKLLESGNHSVALEVAGLNFRLDYHLEQEDSDITYLFVVRAGNFKKAKL